MLASHQCNHSAPAQDRTRLIPPSERGCPLQKPFFTWRSPQPHSPHPDPNLRYSRPPTPEPVYPLLSEQPRDPKITLPAELGNLGPQIQTTTSYTEDWSLIGLPARPFLSEDVYLGCTVPTRNKDKLNHFRSHCGYLLQHRPDLTINHPLMDIFHICPHPIVFARFLWRYRITIMHKGILEDYHVLTAHTDNSDSILLKRAYTMFYSWSEYSYTTSIIWAIGKNLKEDIWPNFLLPTTKKVESLSVSSMHLQPTN
jgi:hypothetical protein